MSDKVWVISTGGGAQRAVLQAALTASAGGGKAIVSAGRKGSKFEVRVLPTVPLKALDAPLVDANAASRVIAQFATRKAALSDITLGPEARCAVDSALDALAARHAALEGGADDAAAAAAAELEAFLGDDGLFAPGEQCTLADVAAVAWLYPVSDAVARAAPRVAARVREAAAAGWASAVLASDVGAAPGRGAHASANDSAVEEKKQAVADVAWRPDVPPGHTEGSWRRSKRVPLVPQWEA